MRKALEIHMAGVYRFALRLSGDRHAAEDLTQETMLRAWKARHRLRAKSAVRAWLFQIVANLWRDQLRRGRATSKHEHLADDVCDMQAPSPQHVAERQEQVAMAVAAMDQLPPRQRQVLYLHSCENLSLGQIAEILNMSQGAVKSNLSVARKTMRRRLRKFDYGQLNHSQAEPNSPPQ